MIGFPTKFIYLLNELMTMPKDFFIKISKWTSHIAGKPITFFLAFLIIMVWAITGPIFHFSDTWQLVINTSTTIVTFLMVFLIQSTQNRDTYAIQLKLDELIRVTEKAHNALMDIEELSEKDLEAIKATYEEIAKVARKNLRKGIVDTGVPELNKVKKQSKLPKP